MIAALLVDKLEQGLCLSKHSIHSNTTLEWGLGSISQYGAGARAIHHWFELWRERGRYPSPHFFITAPRTAIG